MNNKWQHTVLFLKKKKQQNTSVKKNKNHEALCLHSATANCTPTAVQTIFFLPSPFLRFVGVLVCMAAGITASACNMALKCGVRWRSC